MVESRRSRSHSYFCWPEALVVESFDFVFISSCDPPSVSLFSSIPEDSESLLLSDLSEFDSLCYALEEDDVGGGMLE